MKIHLIERLQNVWHLHSRLRAATHKEENDSFFKSNHERTKESGLLSKKGNSFSDYPTRKGSEEPWTGKFTTPPIELWRPPLFSKIRAWRTLSRALSSLSSTGSSKGKALCKGKILRGEAKAVIAAAKATATANNISVKEWKIGIQVARWGSGCVLDTRQKLERATQLLDSSHRDSRVEGETRKQERTVRERKRK